MAFFLRRAGYALLLLLAVSLLTFVLAELAPGDFVDALRLDPSLSAETVETLRREAGLDEPLALRYLHWLGGVLRGDLGISFVHRVPVAELLAPRVGATLLLGLVSTALAWMLALALGSLAAHRSGGWLDRVVAAGESLLLALPEILLALLLLQLAAALPGLSPTAEELFPGLLLPVAVLALAALPTLLGHVRAEVRRALAAPPVRFARGQGLGPVRLFLLRVLPEAAHPLLGLFGLSFGALLSGSLVVEVVFSWPGLGPLVLAAIRQRDLPVVMATVLVSSALLVLGQLLADLWLHAHDPRLRAGRARGSAK